MPPLFLVAILAAVIATQAAAKGPPEADAFPVFDPCFTTPDGEVVCIDMMTGEPPPMAEVLQFPQVAEMASLDIEATRRFSSPEQIPPEDFAAYAIFATNADLTSAERDRYIAICRAYYSVLMQSDSRFAPPPERQLVTVWPVDTVAIAEELNAFGNDTRDIQAACEGAVDNYHEGAGKRAITDARRASRSFGAVSGAGPFLFAWNPAADKGEPDRPLFRMDLSRVETEGQARAFFDLWQVHVVSNPEVWIDGWHPPGHFLSVKLIVENNASTAIHALGEATELIKLFWEGDDR